MKTERIEIRVPTELKDKIYRASKGKMSKFIREAINEKIKRCRG
jgi:hypothetical protein